MKKVLMVLLIIVSCKSHEKDGANEKVIEKRVEATDGNNDIKKEIKNSYQEMDIDTSLIYGVWSTNKDKNSLFEIDGDSIRYVEHYDKAYFYELVNNRLIIFLKEKYVTNNKLLKLSKDSLVMKTDDGVIKLIRITE